MTELRIEWFLQTFTPIDRFYGEKIFHEMLPKVCKELDPSRPYWPSSPYSMEGEDPNSAFIGDRHSWDNGYRNFYNDKAKFASEYGVMSAPALKSIEEYLPGEKIELNSELWRYHCSFTDANHKLMKEAFKEFYKDLEQIKIEGYILASQWIQGGMLKLSFEHYRRRKFLNSGVMFWMYSESWGTVGWTIVDYYLRKKASYYFVKRGYDPILASIKKEEDNKISVWVVNNLLSEIVGKLELYMIAFDGSSEEKVKEMDIKVSPNVSHKYFEYCLPGLVVQENYYYYVRFIIKDDVLSENWFFANEWKKLNVPSCNVKYRIENAEGNMYKLSVVADSFCQLFHIDEEEIESIEDNAFYLNPNKEKYVKFTLKQNGDINNIKMSGTNIKRVDILS